MKVDVPSALDPTNSYKVNGITYDTATGRPITDDSNIDLNPAL